MNLIEALSNNRDAKIMYFIWKWKVTTTSALIAKFFPNRSAHTANKKLWELERDEWIQSVCDFRGRRYIWTLTKKGFEAVKDDSFVAGLPELNEEGFRSENLLHDLVTSAVHLGRYLHGLPEGVELFSEQELRRYHLEFYPDWVPRSTEHRPDGYWLAPVGSPMATVGLEVELSPKMKFRHEMVAEFYGRHPNVVRVLWVVASPVTAKHLCRKINAALRGTPMIHNFVSVPNFSKSGWDALIEHGPEQGKPLTKLLGNFSPTSPQEPGEKLLLDTRKTPSEPAAYKPFSLERFHY